jgi:arylsulfatase A-like enzyme
MDTELSRLVERIEDFGLRERSLLAFYADHGEEFHEHGRMWHGQSVYGEMVRVPLVVWGPGRVPPGSKVDEPVHLIDVMPTLLDYSGLAAPKEAQGQSLRALFAGGGVVSAGVSGGGASGWKRRPVVAEKQPLLPSGAPITGAAGEPPEHPAASESYAIIDGDWKLIHHVVRPPEIPEYELFRFLEDPLDAKNVAAEHPEVVKRLAGLLEEWKRGARAARLKSDAEATKGMSAEQLEQLRSLGYVK